MEYVIGIDLGTSGVKILLVNRKGQIVYEVNKQYPIFHEKVGYSEQNPEDWVEQTIVGLKEVVKYVEGYEKNIRGISFSGQMHGLVLLDENYHVLRNAILWNDTRTTAECEKIYEIVEKDRLLKITKNLALEGFTLPKILWVKEHEPEIFSKVNKFVLPKDYVRYRLTGKVCTDYSDAAGTLLLDVAKKEWSLEICKLLKLDPEILPPLVESFEQVGTINKEIANLTGLIEGTPVFAGGADNACGAIGAGILDDGKTLCSIGTSGVVLSYESSGEKDFEGKVHYFNHGAPNAYYTMGVTLSAGHSLSWFKETFAKEESFHHLLEGISKIPVGANGLLYTPYISGERTPHADANIRGSFIGIDSSHTRDHFVRAVLEGITFSLAESIEIFREKGKTINRIVSIGGGAKNEVWLQIQADIFDANVIRLDSEQGPAMGAAMLAAYGIGWFSSLQECAEEFIKIEKEYKPNLENVEKYKELFKIYKDIYYHTKNLNEELLVFRK